MINSHMTRTAAHTIHARTDDAAMVADGKGLTIRRGGLCSVGAVKLNDEGDMDRRHLPYRQQQSDIKPFSKRISNDDVDRRYFIGLLDADLKT